MVDTNLYVLHTLNKPKKDLANVTCLVNEYVCVTSMISNSFIVLDPGIIINNTNNNLLSNARKNR